MLAWEAKYGTASLPPIPTAITAVVAAIGFGTYGYLLYLTVR